MKIWIRILLVLAAVGIFACEDDPIPCDVYYGRAHVYGQTVDSMGVPVDSVAMEVLWDRVGRQGEPRNLETTMSDSLGAYSVDLEMGNYSATATGWVRLAGADSGSVGLVKFTGGCSGYETPGKLELDVVVP